MPELPEVETVGRTLRAAILQLPITAVWCSGYRLRQEIPHEITTQLIGLTFSRIKRRGKYLLFSTEHGTLIIHLGMSGRLLVQPQTAPSVKHEHLIISFANGLTLRYIDPRRFGLIAYTMGDPEQLPELAKLGLEPLTSHFNAAYLYRESRRHAHLPLKLFLMANEVVVGVGNIYANEILFTTRLSPCKKAGTLTESEATNLVTVLKKTLRQAIHLGGTSIRDYVDGHGKHGNFQQKLQVYGRVGEPCLFCKTPLQMIRQGGRSTFFCPICQKA